MASPKYLGEPLLTLPVAVQNGDSPEKGQLIPVFAHANDLSVRFREVDQHGAFPGDFRVDVYASPADALLAPIDAWLAPDTHMALEYLAVVPRSKVSEAFDLTPKAAPLQPDCWNGSCDWLPGQEIKDPDCPDGGCPLSPSGVELPEALANIVGFALDYVVLYLQEPLPARSWGALRLGAPNGLDAGYHLGALLSADPEAQAQANGCLLAAEIAVMERINAERETPYDRRALDCLIGEQTACEDVELPSGDSAEAMAASFAAAAIERGCLELAPDIMPVPAPVTDKITVRIGDSLPGWQPSPANARVKRMVSGKAR